MKKLLLLAAALATVTAAQATIYMAGCPALCSAGPAAGLLGLAIRGWTSDTPGRSPRPTPTSGSRLNAPMPGGRRSAHATLAVGALEEIAKAFCVSVEDVVLATIAGALRGELAAAAETPTRPLVAAVIKEQPDEANREQNAPAGRIQLQRLPIHMGLPAARLRMIRRDQEQGPDLLPDSWYRALAEWADANAPVMFSVMARLAREFDLPGELARVANLIVTFVGDARPQTRDADLRVEHLYPLGPTPQGINLHVAAQRIGAAVDVGIVATGDTLPDPWRFASGLGDALRELADAALALED